MVTHVIINFDCRWLWFQFAANWIVSFDRYMLDDSDTSSIDRKSKILVKYVFCQILSKNHSELLVQM